VSILLDTTVLVDLLRGRRRTVERLTALRQHGDVPYTTPISAEEIHRGLRATERGAATRLFDGLRIASIGRPEGVCAGDWRRDPALAGITLAQADCLIAAAAVALGAPLATGNPKDFPMRELEVQHWPVGE
jgi:predicted nucleic acid-binding protein